MKRTPRTAGVEPAVGAAATHLAVIDDARGPGPVALVAVLAGPGGLFARDVSQQGLDVATSFDVELLVGTTLDGVAQGGLAGELLAEGAVDLDGASVGRDDDLLAGDGLLILRRHGAARSGRVCGTQRPGERGLLGLGALVHLLELLLLLLGAGMIALVNGMLEESRFNRVVGRRRRVSGSRGVDSGEGVGVLDTGALAAARLAWLRGDRDAKLRPVVVGLSLDKTLELLLGAWRQRRLSTPAARPRGRLGHLAGRFTAPIRHCAGKTRVLTGMAMVSGSQGLKGSWRGRMGLSEGSSGEVMARGSSV